MKHIDSIKLEQTIILTQVDSSAVITKEQPEDMGSCSPS